MAVEPVGEIGNIDQLVEIDVHAGSPVILIVVLRCNVA
jgi:hypothetical protein